ncbi:MAG: response regulator, partial [Candidatus Bathyarchaeia archaeon]
MRVLLIDDSSTMRKIQKKVISSIPGVVDILEASNGKEALEILQKENFNFRFVLCDINMPEMSGIETLKAIRSHPIGSKLP